MATFCSRYKHFVKYNCHKYQLQLKQNEFFYLKKFLSEILLYLLNLQVLWFAIIFPVGSMMARMQPSPFHWFCISWIKLENKFAQLIGFCDLIVGHFYWYMTAVLRQNVASHNVYVTKRNITKRKSFET